MVSLHVPDALYAPWPPRRADGSAVGSSWIPLPAASASSGKRGEVSRVPANWAVPCPVGSGRVGGGLLRPSSALRLRPVSYLSKLNRAAEASLVGSIDPPSIPICSCAAVSRENVKPGRYVPLLKPDRMKVTQHIKGSSVRAAGCKGAVVEETQALRYGPRTLRNARGAKGLGKLGFSDCAGSKTASWDGSMSVLATLCPKGSLRLN